MFTFCEQLNFETDMISNLNSYLEQQERLKGIVKEDKLLYGGKKAGKLGQYERSCIHISEFI